MMRLSRLCMASRRTLPGLRVLTVKHDWRKIRGERLVDGQDVIGPPDAAHACHEQVVTTNLQVHA